MRDGEEVFGIDEESVHVEETGTDGGKTEEGGILVVGRRMGRKILLTLVLEKSF